MNSTNKERWYKMTKSIYDLHDKAFERVSAFVLIDKYGDRKATIAFKFPADGAGRLWCYFHLIGIEMARGYAGGYGYDKKSAACEAAVANIKPYKPDEALKPDCEEYIKTYNAQINLFKEAFKNIGGKDWRDVFRDMGLKVFSAV